MYCITKVPEFHQGAYALLTCTIVFRKMYIMEAHLRPALRRLRPGSEDAIMKQMWLLAFTGLPPLCVACFATAHEAD